MRTLSWTKKRSILTIILIAILTTSAAFGLLQMNKGAQAAIVTPNPPSGCVGLWHFDEGTATTTADSSGNGNTGTISGATWVAGKYSQALSFTGANSYVNNNAPNNLPLGGTAPFTLSFWVYLSQLPSGMAYFVGWGQGNMHQRAIIQANGHIYFWGGGSGHDFDSGVAFNIGSWQFIAAVYDGASMTIYSNGNQIAKGSELFDPIGTPTLAAGGFPSMSISSGATIDEVSIYNRALSTAEIENNYQINPGFVSQLTAQIPKGATQVIVTLSWQGTGSITTTITSPSTTYTEDTMSVYQKTTYSTIGDTSGMLNIKRLSITPAIIPTAQENWNIALTFSSITAYQISVEVQK